MDIPEALLGGSETVWRDTFVEPEEEVEMAHCWLSWTCFHRTIERPSSEDTCEAADCEKATAAAGDGGAFDGLWEALTQSRTKLMS